MFYWGFLTIMISYWNWCMFLCPLMNKAALLMTMTMTPTYLLSSITKCRVIIIYI